MCRNFGVSGRTLLSIPDFPYIKEKACTADVKTFQPDIAIIKTFPHQRCQTPELEIQG